MASTLVLQSSVDGVEWQDNGVCTNEMEMFNMVNRIHMNPNTKKYWRGVRRQTVDEVIVSAKRLDDGAVV